MSDFNFSIDDLKSNTAAPFVREMNKSLPTGKPLRTSASVDGIDAENNLSVLDVGEVMMGQPLYNSQLDVDTKQEDVFSLLTGAGVNKEKSLGVGDLIVPEDLTQQAAARSLKDQIDNAPDGGTGGAAPGDPTQANQSPDGQTTQSTSTSPASGFAVANNTNMAFENTPGGKLVKSDLEQGKISNNVVFALNVLVSQIPVRISVGRSNIAGVVGQGHTAGSLHYKGQAVDLTAFNGEQVTNPPGPNTLKALKILDTITGPRRPDELLGPITIYGCKYYTGHDNHVHLGHTQWGDPLPISTAPSRMS